MRTDERQVLEEQIKELHASADRIITVAKAEQRDLTGEETRRVDSALAQMQLNRSKLDEDAPERRRGPSVYKTLGQPDEHIELRREPLYQRFLAAGFARGEPAEISWAEYRTAAWSGSVDGLGPPERHAASPLGLDQRYAFSAFPSVQIGSDVTSIQLMQQSARSLATAANVVRAIDAVSAKPETGSTLTLVTVSVKQVASIQTNTPNIIIEQNGAGAIIENDLKLAVNEGLDKLVLDAVAASGFQAPGTDPLLNSIRKAMTVIQSAGYNPDTVVLTPAASEALDILQSAGSEKLWIFGPAEMAPRTLYGMQQRVSKTAAAPFVADSSAFGKLYASPVRLATFEADAGTTNRSNVRLELNAVFGVERQAAAVRIAAS